MKNELVSVIIPVYNQELYLDTSLPSVINQQYSNLEILVVNDGSTDRSEEILANYQAADNRIRIIKKQNGGLADAVSTGIREAHGQYICFLDSDDRIGSDYVQNFVDSIDNHDFVAAGFYFERNDGIHQENLNEDKSYQREDIVEWKSKFLLDKKNMRVSRQFYVSRWNKMYRSKLIKSILDDYEKCKDVSLGEDTLFTYLVLSNASSAKTVSRANSYYYNRKSQTSMMSNSKVDDHLNKANYAANVFRTLLKNNNEGGEQALFLYYFLIESLFQRLLSKKDYKSEFISMMQKLRSDSIYTKALNAVAMNGSLKFKISTLGRMVLHPRLYWCLHHIF